jgi:MinD-like ATPase involved in chromosome partitioning or flagellar assembly
MSGAGIHKSVSIHSFKGGTGKSNISSNTALTLAKRGHNVVLLDFDFRAPSLSTLFQMKDGVKYWLNDWLDQKCELVDALVDLSDKFGTKGKFQVGFTNPSGDAINEMTQKGLDEAWQARVLQLILDAKDMLFERHKVNFIVFDTSPGFALSSINAIVASDHLILVLKADQQDLVGTEQLIKGVYDQTLGKQPELILNKMPVSILQSKEKYEKILREIQGQLGVRIVSVIACFCEVLENLGSQLFVIAKPEHPFTKSIEHLATHFEKGT